MTRARRSTPAGILRRLALAALAVCAALAVGELLLRAAGVRPFPVWSPRYMHVADPELGLVLAPSFVGQQETSEFSVEIRTNSLGLRSPEPVPGAEPCVCVLGDSFAFGHGVEQDETAASRLQTLLGVPVQDAGVMSYGTWQATGRLRRVGPVLRPRLCLLFFYAGNDVQDNARAGLTVRDGYVMNAADELTLARRLKLAVKYRSSLYRIVVTALRGEDVPGLCKSHPSFGFDAFRRTNPPEIAEAWDKTRADLAELHELCTSLGTRLVVVCLPARFQVEDHWWREHEVQCAFQEADFDLRKVQTTLASVCATGGIPYLDVLDEFRAAGESLYYQGLLEMHLNPRGQALLAEAVAQFLLTSELL